MSTGKLVVVVDVRGQGRDGQDFSALLGSVARELLAEPDVQQTVQRAVELAAEHLTSGGLSGEVYASVSLVREHRQIETSASSDERAAPRSAGQLPIQAPRRRFEPENWVPTMKSPQGARRSVSTATGR